MNKVRGTQKRTNKKFIFSQMQRINSELMTGDVSKRLSKLDCLNLEDVNVSSAL